MAVIFTSRSAARSARVSGGMRHQYRFVSEETSDVVRKAYYVRTTEDGAKRRVAVKDLSKATRMQIHFVREDGVDCLFWLSAMEFASLWASDTNEFLLSWGEEHKLEAVDAESGEVIWERR